MYKNLPAILNFSFARGKLLEKKREEERQKRLGTLKDSIEYTKAEIDNAMRNFNNVTEQRLVDFYIYKIQAEQSRYDQLMVEYKRMKLEFDAR